MERHDLVLGNLIECVRLEMSLSWQDQQDRQATALYGAAPEEAPPGESPVTLNQQCQSCSGDKKYINRAFKIACLSYIQTGVKHGDQVFSREELQKERVELIGKVNADFRRVPA